MAASVAGLKVCAMKLDTMKPVPRDEPGGQGHFALDGIARAISLGLAAIVIAVVLVHPASPVPGERLLDRALTPVMLLGAPKTPKPQNPKTPIQFNDPIGIFAAP